MLRESLIHFLFFHPSCICPSCIHFPKDTRKGLEKKLSLSHTLRHDSKIMKEVKFPKLLIVSNSYMSHTSHYE